MMLRGAFLGLIFGSSFAQAMSKPAFPASPPCPVDSKLSRLLAGSDLVLIGRMQITEKRLTDEAQKPRPDYLDISTRTESIIKGESVGDVTVRFYPGNKAYQPSNDAVLKLADERAILFLTHIDKAPVGVYFAGYTPDALKRATKLAEAATRNEAARQAQIIAAWRVDRTIPHFEQVRRLVASLGRVSGREQQQVFERLEALGSEAVPAIIAQMDDRRPLRTRTISLVNKGPGAFEHMRHYGPELVVDGLSAILNQITAESFGSILHGGSARQRNATVQGWRIYAADLACKKGK